jgi:beta-mannosidase
MRFNTCLAATILGAGFLAGAETPNFQRIEISRGWKIKSYTPRATLDAAVLAEAGRAPESEGWLNVATMPAMVHDVLRGHGKIEEPWLPGRAEKCRWVAEQDWVYAVLFAAERPEREAWLRFRGLDTIVDVYLNGERVAAHSNMYLPLNVNVSGRLRAQNTLVLHFHTVFDLSGPKPVPLRSRNNDPAQPVRRPGSNYGSYLGPYPYFSRVGVYDRVFLEMTDGTVMTEAVADASLDESLKVGTVRVDVAGASRFPTVDVRVRLLAPGGGTAGETTVPAAIRNGAFAASPVLKVNGPRLWWPRGYGDQPLYRAEVTVLVQGQPRQTERRTIGFRRITMASHLNFVVNGVPVRLWGGDWVTPNWQTEVWDQPRAERLFSMAENANFNVFRVWGEVASPHDDFYELADARGFLLWQDFTTLPLAPDEPSREVCRREAELFVKRLKHHPSILLWCGKNEAAMWSYKDYNAQFTDNGPWPGLAAGEEVGAICKRLDPERYYQPSTPYGGAFPNDPQGGNTHGYTNMWFVPGYDYLTFASEDTRIAAPPLQSLKKFMAPQDLWPEGYSTLSLPGNTYPFPKTWLAYTTSESSKKTGPVEQFYDAADPAGLVYRLGMAEALYYQDTVERQRRGRAATDPTNRRQCGGYIVWKYNDSWPQVYSAKVDYFLEPYHAYYALRRAYAPVMLSFDIGTYIYLWAVNDSREPVSGTVKIRLLHLDRNEFTREITRDVTVAPGQSAVLVRLDQAGIASFRREHILVATLTDKSGHVIARADALADIERRVRFPNAKLDVQVKDGALLIKTDKFARSVTLEGDSGGWFFEDNYFDLVPGEEKIVRILGNPVPGRISVKPWYSSESTTVEWRR